MRSRDVNFTDPFIQGNYNASGQPILNGNYYNQQVGNRDDDFSFSGFGTNDPRKRKAFNPGSYTITRGFKKATGKYRYIRKDYNQPSNTWYFATDYRSDGILDSGGNNGAWVVLGPQQEANLASVTYNNALKDLYSKIQSSDLNLMLTVGERRESARMLENVVRAAGRIKTHVRAIGKQLIRKLRKDSTNPSLTAANLWLQYKYGWLPFYNDIYEATKWHFHLFSEMQFRGKSRRKVEWRTNSSNVWVPNIKNVYTHKCQYLVIVEVGIANTDAYNLSRITSLNPLSLSWELMPFSFVVDWLVDIGGYLELMERSLGTGLSFKRGMVTQINHVTHTVEAAPAFSERMFYQGGGWYMYESFESRLNKCQREQITKTRSILSGFPRPNVPVFQVNMGAQRVISAAALVRQVLLGNVRGKTW